MPDVPTPDTRRRFRRDRGTQEATAEKSLIGLLGWLALAFAAAAVGAIASVDAASFYAQLARPAWAPPASVFGPVWTVLYALMGVSAWLVWRERGAQLRLPALCVFVAQLVVNALWSWLFFYWKSGALAFGEVLILLALIIATVALFWRVRRLAAALLLPYLGWVAFASALTWSVWRANPILL
jgi:benzodiazapine receptor